MNRRFLGNNVIISIWISWIQNRLHRVCTYITNFVWFLSQIPRSSLGRGIGGARQNDPFSVVDLRGRERERESWKRGENPNAFDTTVHAHPICIKDILDRVTAPTISLADLTVLRRRGNRSCNSCKKSFFFFRSDFGSAVWKISRKIYQLSDSERSE